MVQQAVRLHREAIVLYRKFLMGPKHSVQTVRVLSARQQRITRPGQKGIKTLLSEPILPGSPPIPGGVCSALSAERSVALSAHIMVSFG